MCHAFQFLVLALGRLVKWYNCGLQNRCRGFDSLIARNDPRGLLNAVRVEHQCVVMEDEKAGGRAGVRGGVAGEHSSARPVTPPSSLLLMPHRP